MIPHLRILAVIGQDATLQFYLDRIQRELGSLHLLRDFDALEANIPDDGPCVIILRMAVVAHDEDRLYRMFESRPELRTRTILIGERRGMDLGVPCRLPDPPEFSVLATLSRELADSDHEEPVTTESRSLNETGRRLLIAATRLTRLESDPQRLMRFGLEVLCEHARSESAGILEWTNDDQQIRVACQTGALFSGAENSDTIPGKLLKFAYKLVAQRAPLREMGHGLSRDVGELLGLPILDHRNRPRGAVILAAGDRGRFDDADLELTRLITEALGANLQNANAMARTERLAVIDPLTGLFNRRFFDRTVEVELKRSMRTSRPLTLALLDVDRFKRINDRLGYADGDRVIRFVGQALRDNFREVDYVMRWGGDEFAVLLPDTGPGDIDHEESTVALFERVRQRVRESDLATLIPSLSEPLTLSVGCASFPANARDADSLFTRANEALHQAKREGRDRVCQAAVPQDGATQG